jgi:hypothetical protein
MRDVTFDPPLAKTPEAVQTADAVMQLLHAADERRPGKTIQWMPEEDGGCRFEVIIGTGPRCGDMVQVARVSPQGLLTITDGPDYLGELIAPVEQL